MNWVALSKETHRERGLSKEKNFSFARDSSLVPLCTFELQSAVSLIPIVFANELDATKICGLLGVEKDKNLYVDTDGRWMLNWYTPTVFQAFPFKIGKIDGKKDILLIAEKSDLFVEKDKGYPLFLDDGSESEITKKHMELLVNIDRSQEYIKKASSVINQFDLLEPLNLKIRVGEGEEIITSGLLGVNVEKFNGLGGEDFLKLRDVGALDLIFAHLFSLRNTQKLVQAIRYKKHREKLISDLGNKIFDEQDNFDITFE